MRVFPKFFCGSIWSFDIRIRGPIWSNPRTNRGCITGIFTEFFCESIWSLQKISRLQNRVPVQNSVLRNIGVSKLLVESYRNPRWSFCSNLAEINSLLKKYKHSEAEQLKKVKHPCFLVTEQLNKKSYLWSRFVSL